MKSEFDICGLGEREQEILLCLLGKGPLTAGALSRRLKIKRATVYSALENLLDLGLVRKSGGKVAEFLAISSTEIPAVLLGRAQRQFDKIQVATEMLVRPLQAFVNESRVTLPGFTVDLIDSRQGYGKFLRSHLSLPDCCAIWNPQTGIHNEKLKKLTKEALALSAATGNSVREIVVSGPMTSWYRRSISNPRHELHIIKASESFMADLVIAGRDQTAFSLNHPDKEAVLMVQNRELCSFMRGLFEYAWQATASG